VIDDQNQQLGVMQTREAIDTARDRGFDLILVAPQAQPPVCRIMDYGKYKYEKSKREKTAAKKSAANEMKMVRLHPATSEHDRNVIVRHSEKFLRDGHKVRVVCQFKGRENAYPEIGRKQLEKVAESLAEISTIEGSIVKQGRDMTMNLAPKAGVKPLPKPVKDSGKHKARDAEHDEAAPDETDAEFEALQARLEEEREEDVETDDIETDTDGEEAGESAEDEAAPAPGQ
jgi:translation initiation factor IF-3